MVELEGLPLHYWHPTTDTVTPSSRPCRTTYSSGVSCRLESEAIRPPTILSAHLITLLNVGDLLTRRWVYGLERLPAFRVHPLVVDEDLRSRSE